MRWNSGCGKLKYQPGIGRTYHPRLHRTQPVLSADLPHNGVGITGIRKLSRASATIIALVLAGLVFLYGELNWIQVTAYAITSPKLPLNVYQDRVTMPITAAVIIFSYFWQAVMVNRRIIIEISIKLH